MKFLIFLILTAAASQAKYVLSPYGVSAGMDRNEIGGFRIKKVQKEPLLYYDGGKQAYVLPDDGPLPLTAMMTEMLYIPMARHMSCNNGGCNAICQALGFKYGSCVNDSTCRCYN